MSRPIENDFTKKVIEKMEERGEFKKPVEKVKHDDDDNPRIDVDVQECQFEEVDEEQQDKLIGYLDAIGESIHELIQEELQGGSDG